MTKKDRIKGISDKVRKNSKGGTKIYFLEKRAGKEWEVRSAETFYDIGGTTAWQKATDELLEESIEKKRLGLVENGFIDEIKDFEDVDWYVGPGYYNEEQELVYDFTNNINFSNGIEEYHNDVYSYAVAKENDLKHYSLEYSGDATFEKLIKGLNKMGVEYEVEESILSRSKYINILFYDDEDVDLDELQIRFSDHAAKPTYEARHGAADFEVGSHLHAGSGADDALEISIPLRCY